LLLSLWVAVRRGFDVIHAANPPDTLFAIGAFFKLLGKKYVFDQHDLSPETYLSRFAEPSENSIYKILRLVEKCSYKTADIVISTNQSYKKIAVERGGMSPDNVFIVRNGPPLTYQLIAPDPEIVSKAKYLLGYVGTIGPQDGLDYWVRSVHQMVFTLGRRDFLAVVIGNGDALTDVQALAKQLQVDEFIWFTGRLSELESRKLLSAVNVCVQPDPLSPLNDKSTMNKLMEYMALGKPTVAYDLVETRFSAEGAALYVIPNDELAFAKQVVWLLDNPEEARKIGAIGQRRVANTLAWDYSVPELIRAYKALQ
jgi:glycosyltransferase involved in cell wall biosynthesis